MFGVRCFSAIVLLAFLAFAQGSEAIQPICTLIAQPWQPLQNAIEGAPAGAVICLTAGMWTQGISIKDKILTLWGSGRDQTLLMGAVGVHADGISVLGHSVVTLHGLGIYNFRDGVVINNYSRVTIHDVQASGNTSYGVHVLGMGEVTLENSLISYNRGGIMAEDGAHVSAQYSQVLNNQEDGIWLDFASWAWLANNTIRGNERYGIRVYSPECLFVCWRNSVTNNRAGDFYPETLAQKCR